MFETSLAASRPQFSRRNRKLLPAAMVLHGVLLAGVVLASYWSVSEVPDPDGMVGVVFQAGGPPPPLGSGERAPARPPAQPPRRAEPPAVVQPPTAEIPDLPPILDQPADDSTTSSFTMVGDLGGGGEGGGSEDGVVGGTGVPNGGSGGPIEGDTPIIIRPGVTPPKLAHQVLPRYTEMARRTRTEGVVLLEAIIDRDGRVANVRVLKGLSFGLDEEAVAAVSQWRYEPARFGGRTTAVYLTVRVDFRLQ